MPLKQSTYLIHGKHPPWPISLPGEQDNDNVTIISEQVEGCANLECSNPFPLIIKCFLKISLRPNI